MIAYENKEIIYTIGHSTHKIENFISLLQERNLNVIVDIRSSPYSKFANQFNREYLKQALEKSRITYIFMGDLLGARWHNHELLFEDGKVNFESVSQTKLFRNGIARLKNGIAKGYKISLMCSEKEPFDCHRFALVSRYLNEIGVNVRHIYPVANESTELSQEDLEKKMIKKYEKKLSESNLFEKTTYLDRIKEAYRLRNIDIAYNALTQEGDDE